MNPLVDVPPWHSTGNDGCALNRDAEYPCTCPPFRPIRGVRPHFLRRSEDLLGVRFVTVLLLGLLLLGLVWLRFF